MPAERFRGSSEVPLTPAGLAAAQELALRLAAKGGVHEIMSSDLGRAMQTAQLISRYTHAPITYAGDGLHPWHIGNLEGQEVTPERVEMLKNMVHNNPDTPLVGRGVASTRDGESFNSFKQRTMNFMRPILNRAAADTQRKVLLTTHYRVRKLLEAWMRAGAGDDNSIDPAAMTAHADDASPGSIDRLVMDQYAGPQMFAIDLNNPGRLGGGIYIARHEKTLWNGDES